MIVTCADCGGPFSAGGTRGKHPTRCSTCRKERESKRRRESESRLGSRLYVSVTGETYGQLRLRADRDGVSVQEYVTRMITVLLDGKIDADGDPEGCRVEPESISP